MNLTQLTPQSQNRGLESIRVNCDGCLFGGMIEGRIIFPGMGLHRSAINHSASLCPFSPTGFISLSEMRDSSPL